MSDETGVEVEKALQIAVVDILGGLNAVAVPALGVTIVKFAPVEPFDLVDVAPQCVEYAAVRVYAVSQVVEYRCKYVFDKDSGRDLSAVWGTEERAHGKAASNELLVLAVSLLDVAQ